MENKKGVRYKKPPLVEALCEFHFQKTVTIPNIIIGRFYEQIEKDFPIIETHRGIGLQTEKDAVSPTIVTEDKTRFISKDRTKLIQIGPGFLAVNQLKPYRDYSSFRAFIKGTVDTYYKVARPEGLQQISLRYINRIKIDHDPPLNEVFNIGFIIPETFKNFPDPYRLQMEFAYCNGRDKLLVVLAKANSQEDSAKSVMLDFDYTLIKPDEINDRLLEWMDEAHDEIEKAFHACLTESAIASFELEVEL